MRRRNDRSLSPSVHRRGRRSRLSDCILSSVRRPLPVTSLPLQNAKFALVGVYSAELLQLMAEAVQTVGVKRALVVNSMGIDELTPCGPSEVIEVTPTGMRRYNMEPKSLGLEMCTLADLKGGDATVNAQMLMDVFGGQQGPVAGARR